MSNNKGYIVDSREDSLKVIQSLGEGTITEIRKKAVEMKEKGLIKGRESITSDYGIRQTQSGGWKWYDFNDRIKRYMEYWASNGKVSIRAKEKGLGNIYKAV